MADRNAIRSALLSSGKPQRRPVDLEGGARVFVREPTVRENRELLAVSRSKGGELDEIDYAIRAVIKVTELEDGSAVFTAEDYDELQAQTITRGALAELLRAFNQMAADMGAVGND